MSDVEDLERALQAVEADEQALVRANDELTRARVSLTAAALDAAQTRRDALVAALRALRDERATLEEARGALLEEVSRTRARLPPFIAGPVRWTVNLAAFTFYVGSVLHTYRAHHSPGLVLTAVVGLPIAFIALLVAGSLRESAIDERVALDEGPAGTPRGDAGPGEGAARGALDAGPSDPAAGGPRATVEAGDGGGAARAAPGGGDPAA